MDFIKDEVITLAISASTILRLGMDCRLASHWKAGEINLATAGYKRGDSNF